MTDHALLPGQASADPALINEVLKERFEALPTGPTEQPMRFAGAVSNPTEHPRVPASELRPVDGEKPAIDSKPLSIPQPTKGGAPSWAKIPDELEFPRGRVVYFMRFEAAWTDTPWKGDRQCICWSMGVGDKKIALQRSMGDALRAQDEMLKQCVRVIDGTNVTLENAALDLWWDEIGEKCRGLLTRVFSQMHFLKPAEIDHFLKDCIEARSAG